MNLLILSTLSCLSEYFIPPTIKYITSCLYAINKNDVELQNDLLKLRQEMTGLSMVDEFSKYAKLQRKCNKLKSLLKDRVTKKTFSRMKIQRSLTYAFRIINGVLMMVLLHLYKSKPVIILPKDALWPIQDLLSWPCYEEDSISLLMWLIIARLTVSVCRNIEAT